MKKSSLIAIWIFASSMLLLGCQDDTAGSPPPKPMSEAQLNKRISDIQNNPNIPPQGKEIAVRQMKAAYEMMKSQSEGAARGHKPTGS
jgi:hypothetical protein